MKQVGWLALTDQAAVRMIMRSEPKPPDLWTPVFYDEEDSLIIEIGRLREALNLIQHSKCMECNSPKVAKKALYEVED